MSLNEERLRAFLTMHRREHMRLHFEPERETGNPLPPVEGIFVNIEYHAGINYYVLDTFDGRRIARKASSVYAIDYFGRRKAQRKGKQQEEADIDNSDLLD